MKSTSKKYKLISDIYYAGIPYNDFLSELKSLKYPEPYSFLTSSSVALFMPDISGYIDLGENAKLPEENKKKIQSRFQFWTKEYLDGLAEYLNKNFPDAKVLEVGCGNGELVSELEKRGINIIGTDDQSWEIKNDNLLKGVRYTKNSLVMDYQMAVETLKPDVVISSWMPYREDWTPSFRKNKLVKAYILIGEAYGCCADDKSFKTYKGWKKKDDFYFDKFNVCRTDTISIKKSEKNWLSNMKHSVTISFIRK